MWKEWWKIKALHRHFYDFYECLPRSQEGSIRLRGFMSLVFQPVLLLGCCHTIPHVFAFSHPGAWSRLWTPWNSPKFIRQPHPGPPLWALPPSFQRASTTTADRTHDSTLGKAEGVPVKKLTRCHKRSQVGTLHLQIAIVDQFYWGSFFPSLPDLLRLHHVLLDCNALEDLRGTRCKKEFSYSYNRNFWTWSSKMICAHISANAPVTGGVSRRPRSWAAEATGWEDIVRFWEGHIGIPWNPMRVHLGSCRNAVMQQLCSYALSLCFR